MISKVITLINELRPYEQVEEDTELIKSGVLDSLAVFALVGMIEDTFEVEIPDDAITAENITSAYRIVQLINSLKN